MKRTIWKHSANFLEMRMEKARFDQYRGGLATRQARRREGLEHRRLAILPVARQAATALLGLGARRVLLFGSLLVPHRFRERSDVDVLVYGLADKQLTAALRLLEDWPGLEDVEIDLKIRRKAVAELFGARGKAGRGNCLRLSFHNNSGC